MLFRARRAESAERKALNLKVVGSSPAGRMHGSSGKASGRAGRGGRRRRMNFDPTTREKWPQNNGTHNETEAKPEQCKAGKQENGIMPREREE